MQAGRKTIIRKIVEEMKKQIDKDSSIVPVLPLFDLYQQSGIRPSLLNPIDRSVFDGLLDAGFLLQLVPVLIDIQRDYGRDYEHDDISVQQANFVSKAFIKNATTGEMETIMLDEEQAGKDSNFQYMLSFTEESKQLVDIEAVEYTGNESAAEEQQYFLCAMIVRAPELRAKIEKGK